MSLAVAAKVVETLTSIDPVTLTILMTLYIACGEPATAVRLFEAATDFAGDDSTRPLPVVSDEVPLEPREAGLDLRVGTTLMRAQAQLGNGAAVLRILAALEGRSGETVVDGTEVAPWPWTGAFGTIQPDTVCYNVAMAAAEQVGGAWILLQALELFQRMAEPGSKSATGPVKNVVTYNTLISALTRARRGKAALALFNEMKRYKL